MDVVRQVVRPGRRVGAHWNLPHWNPAHWNPAHWAALLAAALLLRGPAADGAVTALAALPGSGGLMVVTVLAAGLLAGCTVARWAAPVMVVGAGPVALRRPLEWAPCPVAVDPDRPRCSRPRAPSSAR